MLTNQKQTRLFNTYTKISNKTHKRLPPPHKNAQAKTQAPVVFDKRVGFAWILFNLERILFMFCLFLKKSTNKQRPIMLNYENTPISFSTPISSGHYGTTPAHTPTEPVREEKRVTSERGERDEA
jgi:hypothetical protein